MQFCCLFLLELDSKFSIEFSIENESSSKGLQGRFLGPRDLKYTPLGMSNDVLVVPNSTAVMILIPLTGINSTDKMLAV